MSLSQNFYVSRKSTPTTEKTDFSGAPATSQRVLAISIGRDDNEIFFSHPDYQCTFSLCVFLADFRSIYYSLIFPRLLYLHERVLHMRERE